MATASADSASYSLMGPEVTINPYPIYNRILAEVPVHWNQSMGGWVIARHTDIVDALMDRRLSANRFMPLLKQVPHELQPLLAPIVKVATRWSVIMDPPEHTRLRRATQRGFNQRVFENLRPRIQRITDELLDAVMTQGRMDLVQDFAFPLPAIVIAELLGASFEQRERFKSWATSIMRLFGITAFTEENLKDIGGAMEEMGDYIRVLIAENREAPRGNLISHLLEVQQREDTSLADDELVAECILLLVAGHETAMNLIGSASLALFQHPEQMQVLRKDPTLMEGALDEFLRYDGPIKWITRMALEDLSFREQQIKAGDLIVLLTGAGNRDPELFPEPDCLDITRKNVRHLGFGHGIHFCEGAPLARAETEIALSTLLRRLPELRLAVPVAQLEWHADSHLRSLKSLPVVF